MNMILRGYYRSIGFRVMGIVLCSMLFFSPRNAVSDDGPDKVSVNRFVLAAPRSEAEQMAELRDILGEHLSDLGIEVELVLLSLPRPGVYNRMSEVLAVLQAQEASFGIWVEPESEEFLFLASGVDSEKIFRQKYPKSKEGWAAECDTIAVMTRSVLTTWIHFPTPKKASIKRPVTDHGKTDTASFVIASAYVMGFMDLSEKPIHGASFSLGFMPTKFLELDLQARIVERVRHNIPDIDIYLKRLPISFNTVWLHSLNRFEFGLNLGLVIDFTRLEGSAAANAEDDTNITHFGLVVGTLLRYRILKRLAFLIDVSTDIFFESYYYTWAGTETLGYDGFQPRVSIGLVLL